MGEELRRSLLVLGRDDGVVERDGHDALLYTRYCCRTILNSLHATNCVVLRQQFFKGNAHHQMAPKERPGLGIQGGGNESGVGGTDLEECRTFKQKATGHSTGHGEILVHLASA